MGCGGGLRLLLSRDLLEAGLWMATSYSGQGYWTGPVRKVGCSLHSGHLCILSDIASWLDDRNSTILIYNEWISSVLKILCCLPIRSLGTMLLKVWVAITPASCTRKMKTRENGLPWAQWVFSSSRTKRWRKKLSYCPRGTGGLSSYCSQRTLSQPQGSQHTQQLLCGHQQ